ncbi:3-hydroxyanthranilate 3,4-dioxygenase [Klugiella xanthotipulae]|uniref:3-hydroxyanthranilate 3,4-dioxygenase n=1 Tax=Klugiella xanthotipulae TaxID=244735 RepID=A0A543HT08_9MICO|nr:3-hydroxyanthranilate 3,4-dioxygenase [Klugiella xanthotipulae]TQM61497.1 3-hydroxyanthranilate 3,4-dioxygenase [Klugiella xanthotipulae]
MTTIPPVINFPKWLDENQHLLQPPVNNKQIFEMSEDFIVMIVGGPNVRYDFHYEPYEEWFYQVKGNMHVNIQTEEGLKRIDIREGEMWLLPGNTSHSPQRPEEGSIGIVVERVRKPGTLEKFQWFCTNCNHKVYEAEVQLNSIEDDMPPLFAAFHEDLEARTCSECGTVHPGKG